MNRSANSSTTISNPAVCVQSEEISACDVLLKVLEERLTQVKIQYDEKFIVVYRTREHFENSLESKLQLICADIAQLELRVNEKLKSATESLEQLEQRTDVKIDSSNQSTNQLEVRVNDRFLSDKEMRERVEVSLNERLEVMNQFRDQLNRQAATFVTWSTLFAVSTFVAMFIVGVAEVLVHHI